ncbi:hypothetical protein [Neobacillus mesonae]|uniref:hypothetical protein n=1 Tax=Neobacillus mesonae TaxID=1193713 RepID=UPI00203CF2C8|nr:hypothetical protein [Neobacillus mesonae]MCM3567856.1 hypothetical protein [Neobacillus mesonae]
MIQLLESVRHSGKVYSTGEVITKIKDKEAQRLVNLGVAFFVGDSFKKQDENDLKPDVDDYQALDDAYTLEELKEVAQTIEGLEFKGNISKKDLITLIIESGKLGAFFEDEE